MKKFKFGLEVVLQERRRLADLKLREFSLAKKILNMMIEDLAAMEQRLDEAYNEATSLASNPLNNIGLVSSMESFISGLKIRIVWKNGEIERAKRLTEKKRVEYVAAKQKSEAISKLRERKLDEYTAFARKHELKQLDDLYIMSGAARRRMDDDSEEQSA